MKHVVAVVVLAALAVPAGAAPWFRDVTGTHLPPKDGPGRRSMDAAAVDFDRDGDLDLVVAQEFEPNKLLLNDGKARFTDVSKRLPPLSAGEVKSPPAPKAHDSEDVSVADFTGDGELDYIFVSEDDINFGRTPVHEYYRGDGRGNFTRLLGQLPDTEANAVAHADLTCDGRPDLLIAGRGQDRLLINDGRGNFRDETFARLPAEDGLAQDAEFVDVDGDKDLDLVLGLEGGHALWINDGQGRFADETAKRLPPAGNVEARKVTPIDIDRDGDMDLYMSHVGWGGRQGQDRLLINDGQGSFTDGTQDRIPDEQEWTVDAKFGDFDDDGDLDMARVNFTSVQILENDGQGRFRDVTAEALPAPIAGPGVTAEIADFDGDGGLDLYIGMLAGSRANPNPQAFDRLLLGVGRQHLKAASPARRPTARPSGG